MALRILATIPCAWAAERSGYASTEQQLLSLLREAGESKGYAATTTELPDGAAARTNAGPAAQQPENSRGNGRGGHADPAAVMRMAMAKSSRTNTGTTSGQSENSKVNGRGGYADPAAIMRMARTNAGPPSLPENSRVNLGYADPAAMMRMAQPSLAEGREKREERKKEELEAIASLLASRPVSPPEGLGSVYARWVPQYPAKMLPQLEQLQRVAESHDKALQEMRKQESETARKTQGVIMTTVADPIAKLELVTTLNRLDKRREQLNEGLESRLQQLTDEKMAAEVKILRELAQHTKETALQKLEEVQKDFETKRGEIYRDYFTHHDALHDQKLKVMERAVKTAKLC